MQDADSDGSEEEDFADDSNLEARIAGTKRMNDVRMAMGKGKGPVFKGRKIAQIATRGLFGLDTEQA